MEHIFSFLMIAAVMVGLTAVLTVGDFLIWLCGKLFPKLGDKIEEFICR